VAIQVRTVTGPIETPDHEAVQSGFVRVRLLQPISDGETLVAPFRMEYRVTDGALPATCKVSTPGHYEFQILDTGEEKVWSFQVDVLPDSGEDISIAELWQISMLLSQFTCDPENYDAANLGSNGASDGEVLTADGAGGATWEAIIGEGLGDMLKAIYDIDDDGKVDIALLADTATLADDSTLFGGIAPSGYQLALPDGASDGSIIVWDVTLQTYITHPSVTADDDGLLNASGANLSGPVFHPVLGMTQVYYLVDNESHVLVKTAGVAEVRLPDPADNNGREIHVKKASPDGDVVTISTAGGATIEGAATYLLNYQYEAVTLVAIDDEWFIY